MLIIKGNVIHMAESGQFDVLVHGCNCMNIMGAGVARQVRSVFPAAYAADQAYSTKSHDMLGTYSSAEVPLFGLLGKKLTVVNAYTQFAPGGGEDVFDYGAFADVLEKLHEDFPDKVIGMPAIGCGLAGGDKERILRAIRISSVCDKVIFVEFG
jgi:O-acetyl-ADP-ribose deacetylase (regulator of RNase III)